VKITDVTLTLFAWDNIPATTYGKHTGRFGGQSQLGLLAIRTDEGAEGHAFLGSASRGAQFDGESLISALKPLVMDQDPLERERLYQALLSRNRQTTWRAIGAVDVALWDLAGKLMGQPIHRLLGTYRERLPAYASSAVLATKQAYAEEAARFKASGWTAYKIHPPTEPRLDIEICEAVRGVVGDAFTLISPEEQKQLSAIERFLGRSVPRVILPDFDYKRRPQERRPGVNHGGGRRRGRTPTHGHASSRPAAGHPPASPRPHAEPRGVQHGRRPKKSHGLDRRGRRRI